MSRTSVAERCQWCSWLRTRLGIVNESGAAEGAITHSLPGGTDVSTFYATKLVPEWPHPVVDPLS
jgi:hypothetical protein